MERLRHAARTDAVIFTGDDSMSGQWETFGRNLIDEVNHATNYRVPLDRRMMRPSLIFWMTLAALAAFLVSLYEEGQDAKLLNGLSAIGAAGIFLLTYIQWRLARQEASFEKYYDRMVGTIENVRQCGLEEAGEDRNRRLDHLRNIRVFDQIDNIEYVFGKYRLGYIDTDVLDRATRNFWSECQQDWFVEKVVFRLKTIHTYQPDTVAAAKYILKHRSDVF